MKVLTSRVVVFALVSILTSFVARAEEKKVVGGDKVGDAAEVSKSDSVSSEGRKIVASKSYVDYEISALAAHTINGAPLSNATNVFFGVGEGEASSTTKTAQVPSIPVETGGTVPTGVIITVQPEYTAKTSFALSLNGSRGARVIYHGLSVKDSNASKIWNSKYPSMFVFNGASWVFLGSGAVDENTEYDVMGVDEGTTGAATDERILTAANLKPIIQGTILTGVDTTATAEVTASDTITTGIGKLQGQINALGANTLTWGASETTSANAYDTTFVGDDGATANAWPTADKTKLIDTAALANALALKQNKITTGGVTETLYARTVTLPALASYNYSTNDGLVANTVGLLTNTINNPNPIDWDLAAEEDPYPQTDLDNVVPTIKLIAKGFRRLYWWPEGQGIPYTATQLTNAINTYSTTFDPTPTHVDGNWPSQMALGNTPEDTIVSAEVFAQGLALKQNKIVATSDGTNNTPNYVYNATTNSTADGSVLTTTTTAGTVGQRGIATAPTYDANDNLTNGSWLPTMSAVESMVSGSDVSSHLVNGQPLSNNQITLYGTSNSTETVRDVTLYDYSNPNSPTPIEMDALVPGTVIVIKPTVDQTGDESFMAIRITNLPGGAGRKPAYYHGNGVVPAVAKKIWKADSPTVWVYDGTSFNYVSGGLDSGLLTLDWDGNRHPGIINAYNIDFDSGTGHWYDNERNRVVPSTTFAQGLALKQNKLPAGTSGNVVTYTGTAGTVGSATVSSAATYINDALTNGDDIANITAVETKQDKIDADMVGVTMNGGDVDLPALLTYGTPDGNNGNDGLLGNKIGLLTYTDYHNLGGGWFDSKAPITDWSSDMDIVVPTMRLLANELQKLYWPTVNNATSIYGYDAHTLTTAITGYSTLFNGESGQWPNLHGLEGPLVTTRAFGEGLALKQNKIAATSDGTNNTPNYVYNATTNSTADGSVLTTTTTAGTVGQRGIATAPTYDANDNLTNGSWLPTMSAVESMVSGSDVSSHLVNGQPLSNNQITLYGKETDSVGPRKKVSLYDYSNPSNPTPIQIDSLVPGMVVVIKPTVAATATFTLSVNGVSGAKTVKYHGSNIPEGMAGKIWNPNSPSVFMYDGTNWNYIAGGEDNGVESLEWASNVHPAAITGYSTAFTGMAQGAWNARDVYSFVKGPTFANALALKQNKLPALPTGNMAPDGTALGGGMTIALTSDGGGVETRYIAGSGGSSINVGGNLALADYVNGSVSLADYATNSGLTGNQIRQTLVTLETLKDMYEEISNDISDAIEESAPTGTVGYVATYLPHTNADPAGEGKVGGEVAIYSGPTAQTPYNATNDANKLATAGFVETKQDNIATDMVGVTMNGGDVDLPALLTYGTPDGNNGNDGLLGNKIGLLTYADFWNNFGDWTESYSPTTGWTGDMDNVVPTLRLVASELRKLYWTPNNSGEFTSAINNYSTIFNGSTGNWPNSFESYGGPLVTLTVFGNALALKQNKISSTSDGTNNTPNYVYNATTNSTADGSVLTTTTTAGTVGQRGIATAPTYDANDNLTNGSWLPTMSAVESMVSGSDVSSHLVNGQPLSNTQITLYGTSDSTGTQKLVTLYDYSNADSPTPIEMDALVQGTVIVIKPTVDQPANEALSTIKITNVPNNGGRKMAKYHGGNIISAVAQKIWKADSPSVWVYDGTNFNYVSGGLDSGLLTLDWAGDRHPGIINAYNTDFDSGTGHWWTNERDRVVPSTTFAQGLALKQNVLPAQASGAPVTIPTYPAYGTSDGVIGKMYLDTSSLYTANDEHFPSSKLINTTLSSYVPKSDALNTGDTNSNLAAVSGAPSWATTNGVASLYRVPGVASGSNWAATAMANWANNKNVPTMDTLANSLAGLYDAVGVSVEDRILNYDETGDSIVGAGIPVPSQIKYTGESKLDDGNQLFWLPQLKGADVEEAGRLLKIYSNDKIVPTMDELAFALDGVLQTNETTKEWREVVEFYRVPARYLFEVAMATEASDENAIALNKSGYLQTFAPTLEALMNESAELVRFISNKQDKLSGTSGNLVTYGATAGTTGSKEIATTITNNANTVPNTAAVYNAVNARQNVIPVAGKYRSSNTASVDTTISDWNATDIKGTALVTKPTSSRGVVGERKIFEAGDTYTDNTTTNIQIATIGAVMENTFTKTCVEYRPGTTGETAANCWLWEITSNTVTPACSANGTKCTSNSDCCSNYCNNVRPRVCADRPQISCGHEGTSCSLNTCCDGLICDSRTNTCVSGSVVIKS